MKKYLAISVLMLLLVACTGPSSTLQTKAQAPMGLLKVTVSGIGEGASPDGKGDSPTATAQWVQHVNGQAATVVPVNGSNALNDVQFIRRAVSFYDNDQTATRYVTATFDLVNRTTTNFDNFTLYAVNVPTNIGGTGIASMTSGTGAAITDPAVARSLKPTHGMRSTAHSLKVNEDLADLQFFTPSEVDNPAGGIKQQAVSQGILPSTATVLEYGFMARNYSGVRAIAARNTTTDCTVDACKGTFTLAYQFPKVSPRQNNPFSFSLYFVVANETVQMGSQSLEEQAAGTLMGQSNFNNLSKLRTLAGSTLGFADDRLSQMCRVKTAISPNVFLGPNPLPSAPGSLDLCFAAGGKQTTAIGSRDEQAYAMALQTDGKIVVAGRSWVNGFDFALARYNPNGSLDTSFDADGKVTTPISSLNDEAYAVAIQADGKIVVAGTGYNGLQRDFALVRYNSNGSLDTTFDSDGKVITDIGNFDDIVYSVATQSDGKIVAAGRSSGESDDGIALVRYNPNGSLDTTFDGDGVVTTEVSASSDVARSVALQSDGKIVVGGYTANDFVLARYLSNGSPDTAFGVGGVVITAIGSGIDAAYSIALQSDGKIVLAGTSYNGSNYDFALARYTQSGLLDTSFDVDGKLTTPIGSGYDAAQSLAIQSDGKIVAGGVSFNGTNNDFALARYNSNGSLDTAFGTGGKAMTAIGSGTDEAYAMAIQSDGKIVVAGFSITDNINVYGDIALARYNP